MIVIVIVCRTDSRAPEQRSGRSLMYDDDATELQSQTTLPNTVALDDGRQSYAGALDDDGAQHGYTLDNPTAEYGGVDLTDYADARESTCTETPKPGC